MALKKVRGTASVLNPYIQEMPQYFLIILSGDMVKKSLIFVLATVLLLTVALAQISIANPIIPLVSAVTTTLEKPADFYNSSSAAVTFNCSASSTEVNLTNISLYTNRSGTFGFEQGKTFDNNLSQTSISLTPSDFAEGAYVWNCLSYNTDNNSDWGDSNRTFAVDTTAPTIEYNSNTDASGTYAKDWIYANITVSASGLDKVVFEWNGTNETFNDNTSTVYWENKSSLASGTYTFRAYVNDTFGNQNKLALRTVTLDKTAPAAVTGLAESLTGASWILWNWTNSTDSDLNHAEVYLNGTFKANTTATSYNATELNTSISYELEVRLADNLSNIGAWANDSATTTSDTKVPNVSLTSPANALSTTATSIAFSCSGADNGMLSNATLYLASSGSNITPVATVNVTGTSAGPSFTRTLAVGSYVWNCQFNDTSSNSALAPANFTLTVTAASNSSSSDSSSSSNSNSGGSSGDTAAAKDAAKKTAASGTATSGTTSGSGTVIHDVATQFNEKGVVNVTLKKGEKVKLLVSNASHEIEAKEITDTNVTLIIRSDPIEVTLKENQSASYDLNNNTNIDLMIVVQSIKDGKAKIVLQNIEGAAKVGGGPTGLFSLNLKKFWTIGVVAAALIVGALGYMYLRRKQDEYVTV